MILGMDSEARMRTVWLEKELDAAVARMVAIELRLNLTLPHSRKVAVRGVQRRSLRQAWLKSIDRVTLCQQRWADAMLKEISA